MYRTRAVLLPAVLAASLAAQTKAPATPADYGQWETLLVGGGGRGGRGPAPASGLSPDGKWTAYGINRSNGKNELRAVNVASAAAKTIAFGSQPAFSADSRWLACAMGYPEEQVDRMRRENRPVENKLALLNLGAGEQTTIDAVESFAFSPAGTWIAMRRYPPVPAGAAAGRGALAGGRGSPGGGRGPAAPADDDTPRPGAILILRNLAT